MPTARRLTMALTIWFAMAALLMTLTGCQTSTRDTPLPPTPVPTPGVLSLRVDADTYLAEKDRIGLILENGTRSPVFLPVCGPWTLYRAMGVNRLVAWEMDCDQDYLAFKLPAGRSVSGYISLNDPSSSPYYMEALTGRYVAELTVYTDCQVGEPFTTETGPKYGELHDCADSQLLVSAVFQIESGSTGIAIQATPTAGVAQQPAAVGLRMLAQVGGTVESVAHQDGLVAAGVGPRLFLLDPDTLTPLGHTTVLPGLVREVALSGQRAFLGLGYAGLAIVDLADPAAPTVIGSFQPEGYVQGVAIEGDSVLLAAGSTGFWLLDASDPGDLSVNYRLPLETASDVTVSGEYAYLLAGESLHILALGDPSAPLLVAELPLAQKARDVHVAGNRAYIAVGEEGVRVADISDHTAPVELFSFPSREGAMALDLLGDSILVADYSAGLTVIDANSGTILGEYDTPGTAMDLVAHKGSVFLADYSEGVEQIEVQDPDNPMEGRPSFETLGWVNKVAVDGPVMAAAGTAGLSILELDQLTELPAPRSQLLAESDGGKSIRDVLLQERRAYVVQDEVGLRIFDIAGEPVEIGGYDRNRARAVAVGEEYAYLVHADGLLVLDIGVDPPSLVRQVAKEWEAADVLTTGKVLYVADKLGSVWVFDVSNPERLVETGRWERPAKGLALGEMILVAAAGAKGLRTAAIGDPTRPIEMGRWLTEDAREVAVIGQVAFLADARSGIHVIGLLNPAEPNEFGVLRTLGSPQGIAVDGERVYLADGAGGLMVYTVE